jgi:DNA (cytosine-5)-methyltransferase 1
MTAIDLFSGCGGLTLGLKQAGFRVLAAVEIEERARETYASNHPEVLLLNSDIRRLTAIEMLRQLNIEKGDLDLIAGCPPCQGFSRMRTLNRKAAAADNRNDLVNEFLRFVRGIRPKMIMLENVPALAHDARFHSFVAALKSMKYKIEYKTLDAAEFSVAQRRKRLILIASRIHNPVIAASSSRKKTVRDVIAKLEAPNISKDGLHAFPEQRSEAVRTLIRNIPLDGGSRSQLPSELQLACHKRTDGFYDVYGRMAWDKVSPTITSGCSNPSKGRFLHPDQHRTISLREASLLQGFPRNYKFHVEHGKEVLALLIGNALPPPFVAAHAKGLLIAALEYSSTHGKSTL